MGQFCGQNHDRLIYFNRFIREKKQAMRISRNINKFELIFDEQEKRIEYRISVELFIV